MCNKCHPVTVSKSSVNGGGVKFLGIDLLSGKGRHELQVLSDRHPVAVVVYFVIFG